MPHAAPPISSNCAYFRTHFQSFQEIALGMFYPEAEYQKHRTFSCKVRGALSISILKAPQTPRESSVISIFCFWMLYCSKVRTRMGLLLPANEMRVRSILSRMTHLLATFTEGFVGLAERPTMFVNVTSPGAYRRAHCTLLTSSKSRHSYPRSLSTRLERIFPKPSFGAVGTGSGDGIAWMKS